MAQQDLPEGQAPQSGSLAKGLRCLSLAAAALLPIACSGAESGPSGESGSIQITLNPAAIGIEQGGTGSVGVSLTRSGGFSGSVTLSVGGLPAGASAQVTPAQLSSVQTGAVVIVTALATTATGTYTATVEASAAGVQSTSATFQLTVTQSASYALTVTPSVLTVPVGGSASAAVAIDRTSFTGPVALTLANPPAGVTGVFSPTPATGNTSSLTVSAAAGVPPGSYPLTVQGAAAGVGVRTTTFTATVTSGSTGNVEYQFCDPAAAPLFFAYQDGDGPWRSVAGNTTTPGIVRYAFGVTQPRGGVLAVFRTSVSPLAGARLLGARPRGVRERLREKAAAEPARAAASAMVDVYRTEVLYASISELAQDGSGSCASTRPTKSVRGTVAGLAFSQIGIVSLGSSTDLFIAGTSTNPVTFRDVQTGPVDLVGTRLPSASAAPDKVVLMRGVDVPNGASLSAVVDFNGPASSAAASATATITAAAGDNLQMFTDLVSANSRSLMWFDLAPTAPPTRTWSGLAAGVMQSGDLHGLYVLATPPGAASDDYRTALRYVGAVSNQTLTLGPKLSDLAVSQVAAGAYPRFRFQGTLPTDYASGASVDVAGAQGTGNTFGILATAVYLTPSLPGFVYDFTMPDVSTLAGFPLASRLSAGSNRVSAGGFGFTGPGIFDVGPVIGAELKAAAKGTTITVP